MLENDYTDKLNEIKKRCNDDINSLNQEFIRGKVRFVKGDIIQGNGNDIILVEKVLYRGAGTFGNSSDFPIPVYCGLQLTKKLTPRKDNSTLNLVESDTLTLIKRK